jgi:hypothetical protein
MKRLLFSLVLFVLSVSLKAQTRKIYIYCSVTAGARIKYFTNLEKALPDSLKAALLIDPRKETGLKDSYDAVLYMLAMGWRWTGNFGNIGVDGYTLEREVLLDEPTWELYIQRIKALETK